MTDRPILMAAPMVRATLGGTKTQTRRAVKLPSIIAAEADGESAAELNGLTTVQWLPEHEGGPGFYGWMTEYPEEGSVPIRCPYGLPGDRLWVRENGWERPERTPKMMREGADTWEPYYYDADGLHYSEVEDFKRWGFKRRPSIHMPRWASRITLEITGVRVERLQDISESDAVAEGSFSWAGEQDTPVRDLPEARLVYRQLWEQINGPGSWDANPWVWVVNFRKA